MTYRTEVIQETGNKPFCVISNINILYLLYHLPGSTILFAKVSKVVNNTVTGIGSIQEKGTAVKVCWHGKHPHTRYPTRNPIRSPKLSC